MRLLGDPWFKLETTEMMKTVWVKLGPLKWLKFDLGVGKCLTPNGNCMFKVNNWGRREKYLCFRSNGRVILLNLAHPGIKFWKKKLFLSSLQISLGLPITSFFKNWAIYNKRITLNLEHTFFLRETLIYNYVAKSFFFVERRQLNLIETKNIPD